MIKKQDGNQPVLPGQKVDEWPPPPTTPSSDTVNRQQKEQTSLTKHTWLDLIIGVPAGFVAGMVCFFAAGLVLQVVQPPPFNRLHQWANWAFGAALAVLVCFVIGRKYAAFAVGMAMGGLVIISFLLLFTWVWGDLHDF